MTRPTLNLHDQAAVQVTEYARKKNTSPLFNAIQNTSEEAARD